MSTILTSLHGRELGLDKDRYVTGPVGAKFPALYLGTSGSEVLSADTTLTISSQGSSGTAISNSGFTNLSATAAIVLTITDPTIAGLRKVISQTSSSTGVKTVTTVGGAGIGFDGLNHIATFLGRGDSVHLQAISTAMWAVIAKSGAVTLTTA